jgi:hypothetical protein
VTGRPDFTAADAERDLRHTQRLQRDPAAQAYGDHLRRNGFLRCLGPISVDTPYDEARAGEFEVRRSMAMRNARP